MKIRSGRVLGLAIVLIIGGSILCFGAYAAGADTFINWSHLRIGTTGMSDDKQSGKVRNINETLEAFDEVSVDLSRMDLEIKTGDTYQLEATYLKQDEFTYQVERGKLSIKQSAKQSSLFGFNNQIGKVTLYLPKGKVLEEMTIHLGVGETYIQDVATDTLDLNGGVGEIVINNLKSKETDVKVGVGAIEIQGDLQGETSIKGGVGSLYLELVGDEKAYNYDIKKGIGETIINNRTYEGITNTKEDNEAENLISINSGIGEIKIKTN